MNKLYKVTYYYTDCEGNVNYMATPQEKYFTTKDKAKQYIENLKAEYGHWITTPKMVEIDIDNEND